MTAAIYNIEVDQGATYREQVKLTTSGNPVDLTGFVARLRLAKADGTRLLTFSSNVENELPPLNSLGVIEVLVADEVTRGLGLGFGKDNKLLYELEIEDQAGDVTKILKGEFLIVGGV